MEFSPYAQYQAKNHKGGETYKICRCGRCKAIDSFQWMCSLIFISRTFLQCVFGFWVNGFAWGGGEEEMGCFLVEESGLSE